MHRRWWVPVLIAVMAAAAAQADIPEVDAQREEHRVRPSDTRAEVDELVRRGDVAGLARLVRSHDDSAVRGWAVVGIAEIGGPAARRTLDELSRSSQPPLVRTWIAAARIGQAKTLGELRELAPLMQQLPALQRPLGLRVEALAGQAPLAELLVMSQLPQLAPSLAPLVLRHEARELVDVMLTSPDDTTRRQAAAFLAAQGQQQPDARVGREVLDALALPRRGRFEQTPWHGGALFVPSLSWGPEGSRELVNTLIGWWLLLDARERHAERQPVWNNLYSVGLLAQAGYDRSIRAEPRALVSAMVRVEGARRTGAFLERIGLHDDPRFRELLR